MYMCIFLYFNYYLPDFVTVICLGFIFGFLFLDNCFNLTQCHNKPLVESSFLTRDKALSLWSGSTDSKTLDFQRTDPESESKVTQLCPSLCSPVDCSLPGSSVHGIFKARVVEWVAISFSRRSSQPRD